MEVTPSGMVTLLIFLLEKFVIKKKVLVTYTGNKKSITLPKGIISIGDNAFQGQ